MLKDYEFAHVYIACGYTDLRYGVDGLARLVQDAHHMNPFEEGSLFLFCGRKSDRIKGIIWEGDGFLLLYKRISNGRFRWPRNIEELKAIEPEQFQRLLSGFTIEPSIQRSKAKII